MKTIIVVSRTGDPECVALFSFDSHVRRSVVQVKQVLCAALTQWAETTADGKEAWVGSVEDFNIGDLYQYDTSALSEPSVVDFLAAAGIINATLDDGDTQVLSELGTWHYDSILMSPDFDKTEL